VTPDDRPKRPARIHPNRIFWSVGFLGEALICPIHKICQNNSAPINKSISDDTWNWRSASSILRGSLKIPHFKVVPGSLSVMRLMTMQSIVAQNVLTRNYNFILTNWDALVIVPFIPAIEMFEAVASIPRVFKKFLETKFGSRNRAIHDTPYVSPCDRKHGQSRLRA